MEAIIIILLVVLIGLSFAIWKDGRPKEQPADDGLQQKVDALQKKMDDSLVRIMFLEDKAKAIKKAKKRIAANARLEDVMRLLILTLKEL